MSLINDALKKAQRLRSEQAPDAPPMPGGTSPAHRITKRGQAMPAQTLILILGGAAVLIVLSAVITVIWLNRTPEPAPKPAVPHLAAHPATGEPSPVIVAPVIAPKPSAEPAPATPPREGTATTPPPGAEPIPVGATNTPTPNAPPVAVPTSEAAPAPTAQQLAEELRAKEIPAPTPTAPKPAPAKPDPRIQIFVDSVRVAGIRFSGNESKVLMNDRVYRVNDVVDRTLNLRLKEVTADTLTFVDANGLTYVKNF